MTMKDTRYFQLESSFTLQDFNRFLRKRMKEFVNLCHFEGNIACQPVMSSDRRMHFVGNKIKYNEDYLVWVKKRLEDEKYRSEKDWRLSLCLTCVSTMFTVNVISEVGCASLADRNVKEKQMSDFYQTSCWGRRTNKCQLVLWSSYLVGIPVSSDKETNNNVGFGVNNELR